VCDGHSCLLCCKNRFAGFSCPAQSQRSPRLAQQVPHYPIATNGGRRRGRGGRSRSLGSTDSFFPHSRTFSRSFSVSVSVSLSLSLPRRSLSFFLCLSLQVSTSLLSISCNTLTTHYQHAISTCRLPSIIDSPDPWHLQSAPIKSAIATATATDTDTVTYTSRPEPLVFSFLPRHPSPLSCQVSISIPSIILAGGIAA